MVCCLMFSGCMAVSSGGAPRQSFDMDSDLKQLEKQFAQASSIENYYQAPSVQARNQFIAGRLVLMNVQYVRFIRGMTAEKQLLDSASDILVLSLNLTGSAADSARVKTILSAIAAGVTGSKATIDKYYFYEKTIPALIAAMNAQRKTALQPIVDGMSKDLNQYPFEKALSDLNDYYMAGTLMDAIQTIQADAGVKEQRADAAIRAQIEKQFGKQLSLTKVADLVADLEKRVQRVQRSGDNAKALAKAVLEKYRATHPSLVIAEDNPLEQLMALQVDVTHGEGLEPDALKLQQAYIEAGVAP